MKQEIVDNVMAIVDRRKEAARQHHDATTATFYEQLIPTLDRHSEEREAYLISGRTRPASFVVIASPTTPPMDGSSSSSSRSCSWGTVTSPWSMHTGGPMSRCAFWVFL